MKIRDVDTLMINSPSRKWTLVRVFTDEGLRVRLLSFNLDFYLIFHSYWSRVKTFSSHY